MKPKITIIIVLSLLITLPSIAFAEKIQPEDEAPAAIQRVVHHPDITPAQRTKTAQVKEEQISGYTLDELRELDTPTLKKIYLETEDSRVLDIIESRWHPTVSNATGSKTLDNEVEPNNDWTTANAITDSMAAAIDPGGDVDYFSFAATAGLAYTFTTDDLPGSSNNVGDTKMYLYDTDGTTQLAFDDDSGPGYYSQIVYTIETDGTYYVKVVGYGSSYTGDYLLTMTSEVPPTDPYEPNNTLATATAIASGDSLVGPMIDPGGDIDLYVFTGTAGYAVRAETCPVNGVTMDTKLYLLAADSTQLAYNDDGGEGALSLISGYDLPADGTYYLKATGYSSYTTGFYNMKLDLLPPSPYAGVIVLNEIMYNPIESGTDTTEFVELYNTGASAVDLEGFEFTEGFDFVFPAGASIDPDGYLVVAGDQVGFTGYYGFPADYIWTSGSLSNSGEDIEIMDAGGLKVDYVDYDDNAPWPEAPDGNGPSLELIDPAFDNSLPESWQASWVDGGTPGAINSEEPAYVPDAYEPNNTSLEAAYIPPGTYDLSLSATQDEYDWFYCPVNAGDTVNVQISFDDTQCDFDLSIYNKDGTEVDWSWGTTSPEEVEYVFPADDTLYICSIGYSGEGPYTMVFTINSPPVTSPWMEGFEAYSYGDIPINWMVFDDDANGYQWGVNTYGAYEGNNCMKVGYNYAGNDDWLVTPRMLVTPGDLFSFMTKAGSSYYNPETFEIWISTANEITSSADFTTCIDTVDLYDTDYIKYYTDLSAYAGQLIYVAIRNISVDMMSQYVDNVALEPPVPKIALSDTVYDFGMIEEGTTASFDVTITNDGGSDLIVTGATVNPPFYCDYTGTIPPGGSDVATIEFAPTTPGFYSEALVFNSNAGEGNDTIELSGIAYGSDYMVEGFEAMEFPPFGWSNPDGHWKRFTNDAYEGDGYARVSWYHDQDASLITPRLIIESGDFISFWWRNANMYDGKGGGKVIGADTLFVEISNTYNDPTPIWEELAVLSAEEEMLVYENVVLLIPDTYIGDDAKIRFRHRSELNAESRGVGLDEVMLPPLNTPVNFYLDPYTQSDYDSIGATVAYDIDVYNTGIQADRYYISLAGSKTRRDVLLEEAFEGSFPPSNWTVIDNNPSCPGWMRNDDWGRDNITGGSGYCADADADASGSASIWPMDTELITPVFNLNASKDDTTQLVFKTTYNYLSGDYAEVDITTDGGTNWTNLLHWEEDHVEEIVTVDLSDYEGNSCQIRFHYYADSWDWYWEIDDVIVEGTSGGGPTPPEGWPVTFSDSYIDVAPGEMGTFTAYVEIPDDGSVVEDDVNTSTIYVESQEDPLINHEADVVTTAHPKDPYEPNNTFADATPAEYGDVTEGAQIYYDPNYADFDVDIYKFDGSEGDVAYIVFDVADTLDFDGAIALFDADSVMLAWADDGFGGNDEALQYRLLNDGTFYVMLGGWSHVLTGPFKKELERTEATTYYTASLELIPSPGVLVEPEELTLGIIQGKNTVSDILYITNTGDEGAINLDWDIEIVIPGIDIFLDEEFGHFPPDGWTAEDNWVGSNSANAGGTAPEAEFSWYPSFTGIRRLISPVINTEGYTSLPMTFKHYVNDYSGGYTVGVATTSDGGTTWNDVWTTVPTGNIGPETVSLTIDNADVGSDNFQVCWYFDGYSFNINYWYIDDVYMATGQPWVWADPVAGSVPQGATRTSTITCDDTTLEPGVYTADIIVHNNAELYGASDVTVPLTLNVGEAAGGLQGTVTFITTGEPIDSVEVTCGGFVAYTDSNGFYQFDPVPPIGTYNILYHKDGFLDHWEYDIVLGHWTTVLDVQMYFDGPRPTDLVAEGQHLCIDLTWHAPELGGVTQVDYVLDDNTYENGWCINPGYNAWLGNLFPVTDTGELVSFDLYADPYAGATTETVTIDVFDSAHNLVGTSEPFVIPAGTWTTVSAPNIPFDGEFYAMVHWNMLAGHTNWFGFDENGPNATANLDWYYDGSTWALLHVVAGADPGVFMLRATAMVQGELKEITAGVVDYTPGVLPEEEITAMQNSLSSDPVFNLHYLTPPDEPGSYEVTTLTRDLVLVGYNVYREDVTTGPIAYIPVEDPRYYRDEIVEVGIEYTYWVTAVYTVGESGPSNLASATPIFLNIENFELDDGGYTSNNPSGWQWGHATAGPPSAHSGENLWGTVLNGNYIDNASWTLDTPDVTLTSAVSTLMFYHWYNTENSWDGGNVKISTDGGTTWTVIIPEGGYPDDSIVGLGGEPGYTANSGGWVVAVFDLADYIGETVQLRWDFGTDSSVHSYPGWYIDDVILGINPNPPDYGALQGTVTDGWGNGIGDAIITAIGNLHPLERYCVTTNEDGYYEIDPIIAQFYNFTCEAEGYLAFTDTFTVLPGETYVEDVVMGNPLIRVEPDSHVVTLAPADTTTRVITVYNDGNAPLEWGSSIEQLGVDLLTNRFEGVTSTSSCAEVDPNQTTPYNPPSKDIWDILFAYDVDGPSGLTGLVSAESDGDYLYTTKWSGSGEIAKFDLEGNYIETFYISGVTNLRDLAYDGTYFYGSDASSYIWQMDFDTQTLVSTIPCPVAVRSIAYDEDNDAFWVNNWSEDLKLVDRSGNVLNTIPAPPSMYGSAYDNISEGGPYLWIFTGTSTGAPCQVEQYDLNTLTLTGVTHSVSGDFPGTIAGGLFTSGD
ncbi:MAG: choice-of-anchor J domain-containing protein, partial [Candidatus Cloacimonetes bacterium]|nr:choice-of-anchor J domain-containing protein [Candidatus Cloacimonadota bacterium]